MPENNRPPFRPDIKPEDTSISQEQFMENLQQFFTSLSEALGQVYDNKAKLDSLKNQDEEVASLDVKLSELENSISSTLILLQSVTDDLTNLSASVQENTENIQAISDGMSDVANKKFLEKE